MKVNIISDIHATVDKKLNVVYNLPNKSSEKVKKTINKFKWYWHTYKSDILKNKITHSSLSLAFYTVIIKTHEDILKIIELYESNIDTEFANIKNDIITCIAYDEKTIISPNNDILSAIKESFIK